MPSAPLWQPSTSAVMPNNPFATSNGPSVGFRDAQVSRTIETYGFVVLANESRWNGVSCSTFHSQSISGSDILHQYCPEFTTSEQSIWWSLVKPWSRSNAARSSSTSCLSSVNLLFSLPTVISHVCLCMSVESLIQFQNLCS